MTAAEREVWNGITEFASAVFPEPRYKCALRWTSAAGPPTLCMQERRGSFSWLYGPSRGEGLSDWDALSDVQASCLRVCLLAHDHRQEFIDQTIEGVETFDDFIQYCTYGLTGYTKSATKK